MTASAALQEHRLLSILPRPILEPRRPMLAIGTGWALAFIPSIVLSALVSYFFAQTAQPQFNLGGPLAVFLLVVFAPVGETLIMGAFLSLLLRFVSPTTAVLLSSLGWGIAHSLQAPAWGLVIWWPFLIFSTLFVVWRQRSLVLALAIPAATHALHNLIPALWVAYRLNA